MQRSRLHAFTLVELLVVIAIIGILVALLLPALGAAVNQSRAMECSSRLDNIGVALIHSSNDGAKVRADKILLDLSRYMDWNPKTFQCPSWRPDETLGDVHYGFNGRLSQLGPDDSKKIVAVDYGRSIVDPFTNTTSDPLKDRWDANIRPRHFSKVNVLFYDGHVERLETEAIDPSRCQNVCASWLPQTDARYQSFLNAGGQKVYLSNCDEIDDSQPCNWNGTPIASPIELDAPITYTQIETIMNTRCVKCHDDTPAHPQYIKPPKGLRLDKKDRVLSMAGLIREKVVVAKTMPAGNETAMTQAERDMIGMWVIQGASGEE